MTLTHDTAPTLSFDEMMEAAGQTQPTIESYAAMVGLAQTIRHNAAASVTVPGIDPTMLPLGEPDHRDAAGFDAHI